VFNVGPMEVVVLAIVGLIVLGPERLPGLARDAARMLRTLRDLATGARQQLREELGPEFADVDLRNLNPRTAVQRAIFGDEVPEFSKYDPRRINPGAAVRNAILGDDDMRGSQTPLDDVPVGEPVSMTKSSSPPAPVPSANGNRPRPRPSPRPKQSFDDIT
jgi:sec-independent protein translocase protein TatB